MVGEHAGACRPVDVALNGIVANSADGERTALHEEVFIARDAVLDGLLHVDGAVFHLHVFGALDGMCQGAINMESALALEFEVPLAVEGGLLVAGSGIGEGVLGVLLHTEGHALAIHDADGGSRPYGRGVGEREAVEFYGGLVGTNHVKLAVAGVASEGVGDFTDGVVHLAALLDAHMCAGDHRGDVSCDVAGNPHFGSGAFVGHLDSVVGHCALVNEHLVEVGDGEHLAVDGACGSLGILHVAALRCRKGVDDIPLHHVERLRHHACCHDKGAKKQLKSSHYFVF